MLDSATAVLHFIDGKKRKHLDDRPPSREIAGQSLLPGRRSGLKSGFESLNEPILWLAS